jgi:hypothetical protein
MRLPRLALCVLLAAVFTGSPVVAQNTLVDNAYYPFMVNTTWTYKVSDGKQLIMKVTKHEKVGNALCARVESSVDGKVIASEDVGVTSEGLCRFQVNDSPAMPPLCFLRLPPAGTTWKVESKIKDETVKGMFSPGKEEITVPLGKFQTVTAASEMEVNMIKVGTTCYFAKDVGMVKQIVKLGDKQTIILELEKFQHGK